MQGEEYKKAGQEITEWDQDVYQKLVSIELTDEQKSRIVQPKHRFIDQKSVLAVHWHPEIVPMPLVEQRISAMYPSKVQELIIPTQHNELLSYDEFSGVEIDCFAKEFSRKVQFLIHFKNKNVENADTFKSMLSHTFQYRSSQFFEFLETIINPKFEEKFFEGVQVSASDPEVVAFVKLYAQKLKNLIEINESITPKVSLKNKLLPNYFAHLSAFYDERLITHSLVLLKDVKEVVKKHFRLDYFFDVQEVIEEVRHLGGGIVIPHPEQFWPILLANYDIDGIEVWNPQSREFTEFLIKVINNINKNKLYQKNPMLVFMGDDTHLSEKLKEDHLQDPVKSLREIGYQPAWDELIIRKSLMLGLCDKNETIEEYKNRLNSY